MAQALAEENSRVLPQSANSVSAIFAALAASISSSSISLTLQDRIPSDHPSTSKITRAKPSSTTARARASAQPDIATLNALGIKVRDFAYESTLPRLKSIHRRQIQPSIIRPLKRQSTEPVEEENNLSQHNPSNFGENPKKPVPERTLTEPAIEPTAHPSRMRGFADLRNYDFNVSMDLPNSQPSHNDYSYSDSQPPPIYSNSQESDSYIHTPSVTPNGSLQWKVQNASGELDLQSSTASRLNHISPSFSKYITSGDGSTSANLPSPSTSNTSPDPLLPFSIPITPTKRKRPIVRSPSTTSIGGRRPIKSRRGTYESTAVTPRYPLRSRGGGSLPLHTQAKTPPRRRSLRSHATGAVPSISIQPNRVRGKGKAESQSPHPRPLRKRPAKSRK